MRLNEGETMVYLKKTCYYVDHRTELDCEGVVVARRVIYVPWGDNRGVIHHCSKH